MHDITIAGRHISDDSPAFVVAEIGNTHNGNVPLACELIKAIGAAGAHAVKLQKKTIDQLYSEALLAKPYDHYHSYGQTYGEHKRALEFDRWSFQKVMACAAEENLCCFSTAFDEPSVDFLLNLGMPAIKLPSGALTDTALQIYAAKSQIPIILSTGGGTIADVDRAVERMTAINPKLVLLQCTATYPCDFPELNLRCIVTMRDRYPDLVIGYSGHDQGIAMSLIAYTLGARVIEKHVTLDRGDKGGDHACALEPHGLSQLCRNLARTRDAMGDGVKVWYESERGPLSKMRRIPTAHGWQVTGELPPLSVPERITQETR